MCANGFDCIINVLLLSIVAWLPQLDDHKAESDTKNNELTQALASVTVGKTKVHVYDLYLPDSILIVY